MTTYVVCNKHANSLTEVIIYCLYRHENKTGFLPSSGGVNPTVWMHCKDADKTHREKKPGVNKNVTSYSEQILEATFHEITAALPRSSHLKNYPSKTNKK